jgi:Fe-S cluster assembly protein SufD
MSQTALERAPKWLGEARERVWDIFSKTPFPAGDVETWRRMPFSNWRIEKASESDAFEMNGIRKEDQAAVAKAGGQLLSLEEASSDFPDLVKPFIGAPSASKDFLQLEAANLALWRGGVFLRVPKGARIDEPVHLTFRHDPSKPYAFPRAVVLVEDGAQVTIVEEHIGDDGSAELDPVSAAFSNVTVGAGAHVRYFSSQELGDNAVHFGHQRIDLAAKAKLEHCSVMFGGRRHKSELEVVLSGERAESDIKGVLLARGDQFFDPHTKQHHKASNTLSNLLFRAAVRDSSRSIYTGLIRIERDALNCEAYQTNKNLLISESARADSTPVLEILPNEVACRHGATAGPVSAEELYYLACRAIPEQEALRMLVLGFFDPILSTFPIESLRAHLTELVGREALP